MLTRYAENGALSVRTTGIFYLIASSEQSLADNVQRLCQLWQNYGSKHNEVSENLQCVIRVCLTI
jgi:hypothetical protein